LTRSHQLEFEGSFPSVRAMPAEDLPEIAFAGRSNVGKSSCINALLNRRKAARVSQRPGRTQALNLFRVDGRVRFVDLPGYGFARVPVHVRRAWGPMVEGYLQHRASLALLVLLLDIRRDPGSEDRMLAQWLAARELPVALVLTKCDKIGRSKWMRRMQDIASGGWIDGPPGIFFSAPRKMGVDHVWTAIEQVAGLED